MNEQEAIKRLKYEKSAREYQGNFDKVIDIAIKALEKQIPKKTVISKEYFACGHCPVCNDILALHTRYCGECGNKIDWTVEE